MAVKAIEKAAFDAYFGQMLVEKRAYFKELIKEVIDEKLMSMKSNGTTPAINVEAQQDKKDPFALEQLMPHFDKILKEDHNLLLQFPKPFSEKNDEKHSLENIDTIVSKRDSLLKRLAQ